MPFLWSQGLRPIGTQVALDAFLLLSLSFIINRSPAPKPDVTVIGAVEWAAIVLVLVGAVRLWDRWTVSFLSILALSFQILQRVMLIVAISSSSDAPPLIELLCFILRWGSNACVALSVLFCVLFPPLQLNRPTGPYPIGAVDIFLPYTTATKKLSESDSPFIPVRIFYPTISTTTVKTTTTSTTPYLYHDSNRSNQFLHALAKSVLPPSSPLHRFTWIFRTIKLIKIPASWQTPVRDHFTKEEEINNNCTSPRESLDNINHRRQNSSLSSSSSSSLWPVVIHSHGLFGSPHMYAYQAITLASHGNVVVMVHHQDGSSPMVFRRDGSTLEYIHVSQNFKNYTTATPKEKEQNYTALVRIRRQQTHKRAMELLSVYESLLLLHDKNCHPNSNLNSSISLPEAVSFEGKLNLSKVIFLGHSFGGATALTASAYRPDITLAVVAHEPATDWMPDCSRRALLMDESRRKGSNIPYSGGTGGFATTTTCDYVAYNHSSINNPMHHDEALSYNNCLQTTNDNEKEKSDSYNCNCNLHDSVPMLVLYSEEWAKLGWGGFPVLRCMHEREQFGPKKTRRVVSSSVQVIHRIKHMEFSDWGALTPLWLGRLAGSSSSDGGNPLESLDIIMHHTMEFLHKVAKLN